MLRSLLLCTLLFLGGIAEGRFLVDYSSRPGAGTESWQGFDQVILDPSAEVTLPEGEGNPTFYAYLSLVEVASSSWYHDRAKQAGLLLPVTNEVWNSSCAKIESGAWGDFLVKQVAAPALRKGFKGFFLDTADSIHRLPDAKDPAKLELYQRQVATLIVKLRTAFPDAPLILNRGFGVRKHLPDGTLSGVLLESVFQTYDHKSKSYRAVGEGDQKALTEVIAKLRKESLPVYVIDYVDPRKPVLAQETARRLEALGASALVSTPDLQGRVLAPAVEVPRKIMVLFGAPESLRSGDPIFVPDTAVARHLQTPLEWMGYDLRYHQVGESRPVEELGSDFAGIIIESETSLTPAEETWYAEWLNNHRKLGLKIFFAGGIPFHHSQVRRKLLADFGIQGSGITVRRVQDAKIVHRDKLFDFEAPIRERSNGFRDLRAPQNGTPLLQLTAKSRKGRAVSFDAGFLADWGGAVFNPYWRFQPYSKDTFSYFDPYALLERIWPRGRFPAPDVTTRQGLRMFWAHVDGDAFATLSVTKRNATCAEVVRDEILKKYPLPTTISVIEAEIRAIQDSQNPEDSPKLKEIAREIFRIPHVQVGSHAFSHPFVWSPEDVAQNDYYDRRHLHLKASHRFEKIDPRREIAGSVSFIERELVPPGKRVEIMLWTGNCRPFAEALKVCREIGIEAMNGGYTIYSPRHPQSSAIAPRVTWWDDELQVYAANQNEFVYTDDWSGPTFGGFDQVIKSFEMLESPRRMKPVNVYYHFYSAVFPGSLRGLDRAYAWSMKQPLHAVTAAEASRMTRDAVTTRIFQTGPKRWSIANSGELPTLRLPVSLGYPDLDASTNILGFSDHEGERYIHTNGNPGAELVLSSSAPKRLYLESSAADLTFQSFGFDHCKFRAESERVSRVIFGGLKPGITYTLTYSENSKPAVHANLSADEDGKLAFMLPRVVEASLAPASSTARR